MNTFNSILDLEKRNETIIQQMGPRSANAMTVVKDLYIRPVIDVKRVAKLCGITLASAYNLISDLEDRGILSEVTGGKRGRLYAMQAYLELFG